jgi:hypothetical protein
MDDQLKKDVVAALKNGKLVALKRAAAKALRRRELLKRAAEVEAGL